MYIELMLREGLEIVCIHVNDILSYNRSKHHVATTITGTHLGTEEVLESPTCIRTKIQEARGVEVTCTHDFEPAYSNGFVVCNKCCLAKEMDSETIVAMTYEHTVRSIT